jgi:uncharacterized glyoxalase superfamily protein PhnB
MPKEVKPIPDGFHTVTPYLTVNDAARAIDFYKRAFGAQETVRMQGPPGKIGHAELKIGDSIIMLADEMPGAGNRAPHSLGGSTVNIFLYVKDVDSAGRDARGDAETRPNRHVRHGSKDQNSKRVTPSPAGQRMTAPPVSHPRL